MKDKPVNIQFISAGDTVQNVREGDFFLVHRTKFISRLIQFGQRLRFSRNDSYWNHAGIFTSDSGDIAEALAKGVVAGHIDQYKNIKYIVVNVKASDEDRQQMMEFVQWALRKPYGIITILSLGLWCIFGGKFDFSIDGTFICSGLVARALERAGYIFDRDPARETPADLAAHFDVKGV